MTPLTFLPTKAPSTEDSLPTRSQRRSKSEVHLLLDSGDNTLWLSTPTVMEKLCQLPEGVVWPLLDNEPVYLDNIVQPHLSPRAQAVLQGLRPSNGMFLLRDLGFLHAHIPLERVGRPAMRIIKLFVIVYRVEENISSLNSIVPTVVATNNN